MSPPFIFPPRPRGKLNPAELPRYEKDGKWLAQRKFNGIRNILTVAEDGEITAVSRHGEHQAFRFDRSYVEEIRRSLKIEPGKMYRFDSEVLLKTKDAGAEIVLYDVLQVGRYLFKRPNQDERLRILAEICGNPAEREPSGIALRVSDRIWLAENFYDDFVARFEEAADDPRLEGLVLRKRGSSLDSYGTSYYETDWMIRCRHPHKNYQF